MKYVKIIYDGVAFYINADIFHECILKKEVESEPGSQRTYFVLMVHSDFAVHLQRNEIIKNRRTSENLIDSITGIKA